MINVTKSFLPDKALYETYISKIWDSQWLTNHGQLSQNLIVKLNTYLEVDNVTLTNNGTVSLQIALRLLGANYDVITTPFSYIATSSSIVWQNCNPIFVDIHPEYLTIDETLIEAAITPNTKAILATHVFGNPCAIEEIERIAQKYNLLVIYDAAHGFGVQYKGQSIFKYGDISTCSFHATKLFHTGEGGAIFCNNKEFLERVNFSTNFGHNGQYDFFGLGINAKMSEFHAAMGLSILPSIDEIIACRTGIVNKYKESLDWSILDKMTIREGTQWNSSYFPIIFSSEEVLLKTIDALQENQIFARRYFYPSLNTIDYLSGQKMPVSEDISKRVLCLPLYFGLALTDVEKVSTTINRVVKEMNCLSKV